MPLPTGAAQDAWPPKALADIVAKQCEWDAWYVGDPAGLEATYRQGQWRQDRNRPAQYRGGVSGILARFWWGKPQPTAGGGPDEDKLHVPIASDICQASSDLLFAEPPAFKAGDKTTQTELDKAVEEGLVAALAAGAEVAAALGDVYLRVTWDAKIRDRSFITTVHADAAIPDFRWGQLVGVTFWRQLSDVNGLVLRHLERHELDQVGNGVIFHGLYQGTREHLGTQVPLTETPATSGLAESIDDQGMIDTKTPGLAVAHVPNRRPQRRWRSHPIGAHLGRSDLDGVEGLMDKLDMVYSSWMRDIRIAKGRLIVPDYMLQSEGPGQGVGFDSEQDVYMRVNQAPREDGKSEITPQQFSIRTADHMDTAQQLVEDILRTTGYSKQTFGEGDDGASQTATEVTSKDRRSALTRGQKIRSFQPALVEILTKKLAVDRVFFSTGAGVEKPVVEFPDISQATPEQAAGTVQLLFAAESASAKTRVGMLHPDWDEKQIDEEVALLLKEFAVAVPDPTGFQPDPGDDAAAVAAFPLARD